MATKKPAVKKNKVAVKKPVIKGKAAVKNVATKKIVVKPAKPTTPSVKKSEKKGLAKPMTKVVVDRITLPKGGKIFVKAAKRPATKKTSTKKK